MSIYKRLVNNNIVKNTFFLSIIEIVRLIMPFIALPYIIRTVGTGNYGAIVFSQSFITYFIVIIAFGLDISAVKSVSENRENKKRLSGIVSSVFAIKLSLFIVSFIILFFLIFFIADLRQYKLLLYFSFISCISDILFPAWFFQGIEKMGTITLVRFSSILIYVLTVFIFIKSEGDYIYVPLLQSLTMVSTALIGVGILFKKYIYFIFPSAREVYGIFKESIPFFLSRVSVVLNHNLAKTFTGIFLGMNEVAIYDIAQKIITASFIPIQMVNQAIFPHNANKKEKHFAKKALLIVLSLSFVLVFLIVLVCPYIIQYLKIEDVQSCIRVTKVLCLWLIAASISFYLGSPVLVAFGFPGPFNKSVLYSTVLLIILYAFIYITHMFSIYSFAAILVLTELFIAIYRYLYCKYLKIL